MHTPDPIAPRGIQRPLNILPQSILSQSGNPLALLLVLLCFSVLGRAKDHKPLKVFILAGQSNMQGHAHVRTFDHIGMDSKTAPMLLEMRQKDGQPRICEDVWISYLSSEGEKQGRLSAGFGASEEKIGPEFTFGIYIQKQIDEPILIIKTAWGGKSLHTDFRSPSAGPYVFTENQREGFERQGKDMDQIRAEKDQATGHYYRLMVNHVKQVLSNIKHVYPAYQADQGFELAGFVWFQGWNDMVDRGVYPNRDLPGGYDNYSIVMGILFEMYVRICQSQICRL